MAEDSFRLWIGDCRHERAGEQGPHAWYFHQPAAQFGFTRVCAHAAVILKDLVLHHGKLCRQHLQAEARIGGHARVFLICDDGKKLIDAATPPMEATMPNSERCARSELESWVRWRLSINRTRCSIITLCCSGVLTGTKRMVGRVTASQIASASAASFLPRLT